MSDCNTIFGKQSPLMEAWARLMTAPIHQQADVREDIWRILEFSELDDASDTPRANNTQSATQTDLLSAASDLSERQLDQAEVFEVSEQLSKSDLSSKDSKAPSGVAAPANSPGNKNKKKTKQSSQPRAAQTLGTKKAKEKAVEASATFDQLVKAINRMDSMLARDLIERNPDLASCIDPETEDMAFHHAARCGDTATMKILIWKSKFSPACHNKKGESPLSISALAGDIDLVKMLIDAQVDDTPLLTAMNVLSHLKKTRKIDASKLREAKQSVQKAVDEVFLLIKLGDELCEAIKRDNTPLAIEKINEISDVDGNFWNTHDDRDKNKLFLCFAAERGNLDVVNLLLEKGLPRSLSDTNRDTPLHLAVANGHWAVMDLLLCPRKGETVRMARNSGHNTPLHLLAKALTAKNLKQTLGLLKRLVVHSPQVWDGSFWINKEGKSVPDYVHDFRAKLKNEAVIRKVDEFLLECQQIVDDWESKEYGKKEDKENETKKASFSDQKSNIIEQEADLSATNDDGDTVAHVALNEFLRAPSVELLDIVVLLIKVKPQSILDQQNREGETIQNRLCEYMLAHQHEATDPKMILLFDDLGHLLMVNNLFKILTLGDPETRHQLLGELYIGDLDLNSVFNDDGLNPLHYTTRVENPDTIAFLLEQGADPRALDKKGRTAVCHSVFAIAMNDLYCQWVDSEAGSNNKNCLDGIRNSLAILKLFVEHSGEGILDDVDNKSTSTAKHLERVLNGILREENTSFSLEFKEELVELCRGVPGLIERITLDRKYTTPDEQLDQ